MNPLNVYRVKRARLHEPHIEPESKSGPQKHLFAAVPSKATLDALARHVAATTKVGPQEVSDLVNELVAAVESNGLAGACVDLRLSEAGQALLTQDDEATQQLLQLLQVVAVEKGAPDGVTRLVFAEPPKRDPQDEPRLGTRMWVAVAEAMPYLRQLSLPERDLDELMVPDFETLHHLTQVELRVQPRDVGEDPMSHVHVRRGVRVSACDEKGAGPVPMTRPWFYDHVMVVHEPASSARRPAPLPALIDFSGRLDGWERPEGIEVSLFRDLSDLSGRLDFQERPVRVKDALLMEPLSGLEYPYPSAVLEGPKSSSAHSPIKRLYKESLDRAVLEMSYDIQAIGELVGPLKERMLDGLDILNWWDDAHSNAGYFVNDRPLGLMSYSDNKEDVRIYNIVTHPLSKGVGKALVEEAVAVSVKNGHQGRLILRPVRTALPAYAAMGFIGPDLERVAGSKADSKADPKSGFDSDSDGETECDELTLDPAASPLWDLKGGQWRFKRDIVVSYVMEAVGELTRDIEAQAAGEPVHDRHEQMKVGKHMLDNWITG